MSPFGIHSDERVAAFIDGPNLYAASKQSQVDIDYKKLLAHFEDHSRFLRAYYYTAIIEDTEEYTPIKPLIDWLGYNGYSMVTKPVKEFRDESTGMRRHKGNMGIELTVDMLTMSEHIDHAILFGSDGDYLRLVKAVQARGTKVTVVSTVASGSPMISDELRRQADRFVEIKDLRDIVGRTVSDRPPAR